MKQSFSLIIFVFLLGATALWYFGIHRPSEKMRNSKPKPVYKTTTPIHSPRQPVIRVSTVPTTLERKNETGMESPTGTENVVRDTTAETTDRRTSDTIDHREHKGSDEHTQAPYEQEVSEHEHSHEHAESESSKELLGEASIALEEASKLQKEAHLVLANELKALPVEKQLVMLEEMKSVFISAKNPWNGGPTFDNREQAIFYWRELFEGLLAAGYTPPAGFE